MVKILYTFFSPGLLSMVFFHNCYHNNLKARVNHISFPSPFQFDASFAISNLYLNKIY